MKRFEGGCHCRAVRFQVDVEQLTALACNCSICRMKGFLHVIVAEPRFTMLTDREALGTYSFNTHVAKHWFCKTCGITSFYRPRSHPDGLSVNLRCLDGDAMDRFEISDFDGANWEKNVASIQTGDV